MDTGIQLWSGERTCWGEVEPKIHIEGTLKALAI